MITPKKLDDVLPPEMREFTAHKIVDYLDKDLIIHACREVQGQKGSYMRIVVSLTPESDQFYIATGAAQPVEILSYLDRQRLFPVVAKFVKSGNAIILKP